MFGKLPKKEDKRNLMLSNYIDIKLPKAPNEYKKFDIIKDWGMLGNDRYGDCVFAGAAHETMLWTKIGDTPDALFREKDVLSDYGAVTGFNPINGANDNGTNVLDALKYRSNIGILDISGVRHKIGAYMEIEVPEFEDIKGSVYLFKSAAIGIECPAYIMDQLKAGKPWDLQEDNAQVEGGHYIPVVGYDEQYLYCVTWGQIQPMTWQFYETHCDEAYAMISEEMLIGGKSVEGFDIKQLQDNLREIHNN